MKKKLRILGIIIALLIFTSSLVVWSVTSKNDENIGISYEQAITLKKPFVLMFHTPWCGYCKAFKPVFKDLSKIYQNDYNFVMVNGDNPADMGITQDYAIGSFPSLFIVDSSIDNRIYINPTIYGDEEKIKAELNRYLRIRAMIK